MNNQNNSNKNNTDMETEIAGTEPVLENKKVKNIGVESILKTYSWIDGEILSASSHKIGTAMSGTVTRSAYRMYLKIFMPPLPRNTRIKKAELKIYQSASDIHYFTAHSKLALYQVKDDIQIGSSTPEHSSGLIDYELMKKNISGKNESYTFDITKIVDVINRDEFTSTNLVLMAYDEKAPELSNIIVYGSTSSRYAPELSITYEPSYVEV